MHFSLQTYAKYIVNKEQSELNEWLIEKECKSVMHFPFLNQ